MILCFESLKQCALDSIHFYNSTTKSHESLYTTDSNQNFRKKKQLLLIMSLNNMYLHRRKSAVSPLWIVVLLSLLAMKELYAVSLDINSMSNYGATPSGCEDTIQEQGYSRCAVNCLSGPQCKAFMFQKDLGTCKICNGEQISNLTFSDEPFYFRRTQWAYNEVGNETRIELSRTLVPGDMIYLSVTILNDIGILFNLEGDRSKTHILHVKIKLDTKVVILNTSERSKWSGMKKFTHLFPFAQDKRTDVHILATEEEYMIYIDKEFCCNYTHILPLEDVLSLQVTCARKTWNTKNGALKHMWKKRQAINAFTPRSLNGDREDCRCSGRSCLPPTPR